MTIQQLQYIIAVDKFRSFAKAAEYCDITQPTLSKMVANLEEELDVRIFDRNSRYVSPTKTGNRIIELAVKAVSDTERIIALVNETKNTLAGGLHMSVGPSIAPYILPDFIRIYGTEYPDVKLSVEELRIENMFDALLLGSVDAGIAIGGAKRKDILEIPLYTEPFMVYLSERCIRKLPSFTPEQLSHEGMWVMKEAQCLRESAFSFCKARDTGKRIYEAGNIETLVRVVDANGGFTIIPEMHLPFLSERQLQNVRPLTGDCRSMRKVSLYIRHDYVRERLLNSIIATIIKIVPTRRLDPFIQKGDIRL